MTFEFLIRTQDKRAAVVSVEAPTVRKAYRQLRRLELGHRSAHVVTAIDYTHDQRGQVFICHAHEHAA